MEFKQLKLSAPLQKALSSMHYETLTPIQEKVIPKMLKKEDMVVQSMTGSGKTLAYVIPILQRISFDSFFPQALILVPTRELAQQVKRTLDAVGLYLHTHHQMLVGKQSFHDQKEDMKQRTHVIVATPGRLYQHIQEKTVDLHNISMLIIDEADEMFHLGFRPILEKIISYLPKQKQTACFSATFPDEIRQFIQKHITSANWIQEDADIFPRQLTQLFYAIKDEEKFSGLLDILQSFSITRCIIFMNTIEAAQQLSMQLSKLDLLISTLHGKQTQEDRFASLQAFRDGQTRILIASNVAARGLDIDDISLIINYDFPLTAQSYIHRVGRSARMKKAGLAVSLVGPSSLSIFQQLQEIYPYFSIQPLALNRQFSFDQLRIPIKPKVQKEDLIYQDVMKLCIFAGKSKKIRPGDLVGAICAIDGVTSEDIGVIKVQEHNSYVEILNGKGEHVLQAFQTQTIKKKHIRVEKAIK